LKLQARFLEKWTEQFLRSAGLKPGMRVLDLGCGMADEKIANLRAEIESWRHLSINTDGNYSDANVEGLLRQLS
jgi:ubiquinone/menaquinone biosynthesis C-methylase UbiE